MEILYYIWEGIYLIQENQRLFNKLNIFSDIVILFLSIIFAYYVRFYIFDVDTDYIKLDEYIKFCVILSPFQYIIYQSLDLYSSFRVKSFIKEVTSIIKANSIFLVFILGMMFAFKIEDLSRLVISLFYVIFIALVCVKRFILRNILYEIRKQNFNLKKVLIIGNGDTAKKYLDAINSHPEYGFNYLGFVASDSQFDGDFLGEFSNLYDIIQYHKPDEVVCAIDANEINFLEDIVFACENTGTKISIIPFCYRYFPSKPSIDLIDDIPLINIRKIPLDNFLSVFLKRLIDIVGSIFLILLFSPVMIFVAIYLKLTTNESVIFKQKRVGLNKELFYIYKFRSMVSNPIEDLAWTRNNDTRKTKFGAFIRKYSIDEFPQFFNVLKGDMSLVGPRPEIPHFVKNFQKEIPLYMVKHQVKPGITGWAQINGYRGNTSIKKRIEHDIYYIENWSLVFDIVILFTTLFKGFKNEESLEVDKNAQKNSSNTRENG